MTDWWIYDGRTLSKTAPRNRVVDLFLVYRTGRYIVQIAVEPPTNRVVLTNPIYDVPTDQFVTEPGIYYQFSTVSNQVYPIQVGWNHRYVARFTCRFETEDSSVGITVSDRYPITVPLFTPSEPDPPPNDPPSGGTGNAGRASVVKVYRERRGFGGSMMVNAELMLYPPYPIGGYQINPAWFGVHREFVSGFFAYHPDYRIFFDPQTQTIGLYNRTTNQELLEGTNFVPVRVIGRFSCADSSMR